MWCGDICWCMVVFCWEDRVKTVRFLLFTEWIGFYYIYILCFISACANLSVSLEDLRVYADCKAFYEKHQSNVMMKRVFIGLGSTISVLLFVLILYFFVFQNNICAKRREEKEFKNIAARAALLNERSRRNAENIYVLWFFYELLKFY